MRWLTRQLVDAQTQVALRAAEYESVRSEAIEAFRTAQSIIQWTLASYGVLFGAGLLTMSADIAEQHRFAAELGTIVIFAALPGLVTTAAWQWLGELTRMERASAYLRGLEYALRDERRRTTPWPFVLNWETFLRGTSNRKNRNYKRRAPYLGTACMFAGITYLPIVLGTVLQLEFAERHPDQLWWPLGFLVWNVVIGVAFLAVSLILGMEAIAYGNKRYDVEADLLVAIRDGGSATIAPVRRGRASRARRR